MPFWRAKGGGVWRKVGRGVCVLNIKKIQNQWKTPQISLNKSFSSFLLQIMPPAPVALRNQVFLTKLVKTKNQVVHR